MPPVASFSEADECSNHTGTTTAKSNTVIIFDWDDTLFASSYLSGRGYRLDSEIRCMELSSQLKDLESSVSAVLKLALSFGPVHVITNAETGWVQMSAEKFMPGVLPLLDKCSVLSARSSFEHQYPDAPIKWKFAAFQQQLQLDKCSSSTATTRNVLSFGDSHVEREAVRAVTRNLPHTRTKSVKFAERPSLEQLRRQIELVTNCFQYIHNHEGDLDLQLTVTIQPSTPSPPSSPSSSSASSNFSSSGQTQRSQTQALKAH